MRKVRLLLVLFVVSVLSVGGNAGAQTRTLNVGDANINYDVTGKGPTVVFIHGWTHNIRWDPLESTCRHASLSIL